MEVIPFRRSLFTQPLQLIDLSFLCEQKKTKMKKEREKKSLGVFDLVAFSSFFFFLGNWVIISSKISLLYIFCFCSEESQIRSEAPFVFSIFQCFDVNF
uniref:Uncharacterized protein n=1 Tax=Noccaea caerulescens TaxID=107243 RepID=A0A1J3EJW9_NOCCA